MEIARRVLQASPRPGGPRREKLDEARRGVEVSWQRDCDSAVHGDQRAMPRRKAATRQTERANENIQVD